MTKYSLKIELKLFWISKIRIWKEMTIILCITITANTFYNKTILEFSNDDQFLHLLFLFSHYSLQFLFYINVRFFFRNMTTKQFETLFLFASRAVSKHDSKFLYFHFSTSSFFRRFWKLLVLCSIHDVWFDLVAILIVSTSSIQTK